MTKDCFSIQQMRELAQKNWPQIVTPSSDLVVSVARLRDLLFENDRPIITSNNLTAAEFDALVTLRKMPCPHELSPTSLGKAMLITSGGLTKVLHQLNDRGLIYRVDDETDRRISRVRLTAEGIKLAEDSLHKVLDRDARLLDQVVSKEELLQLNQLLQKVLNGVESLVHRY